MTLVWGLGHVLLWPAVVLNLWYAFLWRRRERQLTVVLRVVMSVCVQAFRRQHWPIWAAWMDSLGSLEVHVQADGYKWDYDPTTGVARRSGEGN